MFQGTKFSHIILFQIFTEISFTDQEFPLATPTFSGRMHLLCSQLKQWCAWLLTSKSKRFAWGWASSRAFSVSFVGAQQLMCLKPEMPPHWQCNGCQRNLWGGTQESGSICFETRIERHVALDVHASGIAIVLFPDHTTDSWAIYPKSFKELTFCGTGRIRENRKNYASRNLALYSMLINSNKGLLQ